MRNGDLLILSGREVLSLISGRELEVIEAVRAAYEAHAAGKSALPHSTFLRFPGHDRNRIIALPAYLGDGFEVAGLKWIASFPDNHEAGLDRASAVIIFNSMATGRPEAVLEGSIISAKRTAASAALAAGAIHVDAETTMAGMIGCGLINFELARFLSVVFPKLERLIVHDIDRSRALEFKEKCKTLPTAVEVEVAEDIETVLRSAKLISFATTAVKPYVADLSGCQPGSTILHVSLRDLLPEAILAADNVVDDVDHICRAETSVHLAQQVVGNTGFIRCTLADILSGRIEARAADRAVTVFSPFGLGVLDMAVGKLVYDLGVAAKEGTQVEAFFPGAWQENVLASKANGKSQRNSS